MISTKDFSGLILIGLVAIIQNVKALNHHITVLHTSATQIQHVLPGDKVKITCTGVSGDTALFSPPKCFESGATDPKVYYSNVPFAGTDLSTFFAAGFKDATGITTWAATTSVANPTSTTGSAITSQELEIPANVNIVGYFGCGCTFSSAGVKMAWFYIEPPCTSDAVKGSCGGNNATCFDMGCGAVHCNTATSSSS